MHGAQRARRSEAPGSGSATFGTDEPPVQGPALPQDYDPDLDHEAQRASGGGPDRESGLVSAAAPPQAPRPVRFQVLASSTTRELRQQNQANTVRLATVTTTLNETCRIVGQMGERVEHTAQALDELTSSTQA